MKYLVVLSLILLGCSIGPVAPAANICSGKEVSIHMIINGDETDLYPEVAKITSSTGDLRCTAVLIGKKTLLTAGHCIWSGISKTYVVLGDKINRHIDSGLKHPKTDIGLVFLKETVNSIEPVKLSYSEPIPGDNVLLFGYGKISSKPNQNILPKKLIFGCNHVTEVLYGKFFYNAYDKSSICDGDSGGPTYIDGLLAGIHSSSIYSLQYYEPGTCGKGKTLDVRVDYYLDWILENLNDDKISIGKIERF